MKEAVAWSRLKVFPNWMYFVEEPARVLSEKEEERGTGSIVRVPVVQR